VAYLYITGDRFLVEKDDRILADLPYHKLENVLVFGHVQVTTQAMGELLERGVRLSVFSRQLRYRGSLTPAKGKNVELRLRQFDLYRDEARGQAWARSVVRAKIGNGRAVLERYARRGGRTDKMEAAVATMTAALADLEQAPDMNSLLGLEGGAARAYFGGLMSYNRSGHAWDGRKKAPAPDPLNALLSLTYTLLTHEFVGLLDALGLDPHVGFLHQLDYGRPSLALDLLEPFRHPVADRFVITVVNRGMFQADDFHPVMGDRGEGLALTAGALREFFGAYERWMIGVPEGAAAAGEGRRLPFRQAMRREVESFAGVLRDGKEWEPYVFGEEAAGGEEESDGGVSLTI
jgi:CRISPR-associated protein Cas1